MLGDTSAKNSTTVLKSAAENDIIKTDTKAINEGESKSPTQTRGSPEVKASREISHENKENLSKGEFVNEQETQDSGLLVHGRETSAVSGSKNNQREQGYDSANPSTQVAHDGIDSGRYAGKSGYNGKVAAWLSGKRFISQANIDRFRQTLLRDRAGLKSTDVNGKTVPTEILQAFKDTIFTDAQ